MLVYFLQRGETKGFTKLDSKEMTENYKDSIGGQRFNSKTLPKNILFKRRGLSAILEECSVHLLATFFLLILGYSVVLRKCLIFVRKLKNHHYPLRGKVVTITVLICRGQDLIRPVTVF